MKIDHQKNSEYRFLSVLIDFIDFHRYYRFFLFELSFATHHAEGLATVNDQATDFLVQEKYFTYRYSKPTLMVPFHNTHYQYHIHIRPDAHAVYAASPGSKLKLSFKSSLLTKIDDNR